MCVCVFFFKDLGIRIYPKTDLQVKFGSTPRAKVKCRIYRVRVRIFDVELVPQFNPRPNDRLQSLTRAVISQHGVEFH